MTREPARATRGTIRLEKAYIREDGQEADWEAAGIARTVGGLHTLGSKVPPSHHLRYVNPDGAIVDYLDARRYLAGEMVGKATKTARYN